jgi:tripartite-type tricarboxylate transporter receptor subunit TctC
VILLATFEEQGLAIVFNSWYGVATPKDLPPDIATKLAEGFKAMISDPELKRNMDAIG